MYVGLDFPHKTQLAEEQKKYNDDQQKRFGVQGFPTVFVLDSQGRPYARTGYQQGGPDGYLKHIEGFASRKAELDKLLKATKEGSEADRAKALDEALVKLTEWKVDGAYLELKELGVELDPKNAAGKRAKYAKELATAYTGEKAAKYLKILKEIDPDGAAGIEAKQWIDAEIMPLLQKKDWQGALDKITPKCDAKGEAGQQYVYFQALCNIRLGNKEKCIELLEKAVELAPKTEFADNIRKQLTSLKK